jgi:hypothetical protein
MSGYTYRDIDLGEGFIKYVIGIGSGSMIVYIPSFIKIGSGLHKLYGDTQMLNIVDTKVIAKSYFYFFQNKENRLIEGT